MRSPASPPSLRSGESLDSQPASTPRPPVSTPRRTSPHTRYHASRMSSYLQVSYPLSKEYDYKQLITPLESYSFATVRRKPNAAYVFRKHPGGGGTPLSPPISQLWPALGVKPNVWQSISAPSSLMAHQTVWGLHRIVIYIEPTPRACFASKEASRSCVQH
jgi:hypothetical protein